MTGRIGIVGGARRRDLAEEANSTPVLLAAKGTRLFPHIILVRQNNRLPTNSALDASQSSRLLALTRDGLAVRGSLGWPARLQVNGALAGAHSVSELELGLGEGSGIIG